MGASLEKQGLGNVRTSAIEITHDELFRCMLRTLSTSLDREPLISRLGILTKDTGEKSAEQR